MAIPFSFPGDHQSQLLDEIFAFSGVAAASVDPNSKIVTPSPEFNKLFQIPGVAEKYLLEDFLCHHIDKAHHDCVHQALKEVQQSGRTIEFECCVSSPGNVSWVSFRLIPGQDQLVLLGKDISEVRLRSEATSTGRREMEEVLNNIADGFFSLDHNLTFVQVNNTAAAMAGKHPDEMTGRNLLEVLPFMKNSWIVDEYKTAIATQQAKTLDYELQTQQNLHYQIQLLPRQGGIYVFYRNITAARIAADNEEKLRSITDHLSNGLVYQYQLNETGLLDAFTYVSSGGYKLFGLTPEDVRANPRSVLALVHPEDLEMLRGKSMAAWRDMCVFEVEFRILSEEGATRWLQARASPKPTGNGKSIWNGLLMDITERKWLELSLRSSETKLRCILDGMNSGVVVVDTTGQITYANGSSALIMQQKAEVITDEHYASQNWGVVDELGNPVRQEDIPLSRALREKASVVNETIGVLDSTGRRVWININAAPLFDDSQNLTGAVASFVDVTASKNASVELKDVYEELDAILNASTDSSFLLDAGYHIRIFNKTAERTILQYYNRQIVRGDSILDFLDSAIAEDFKANFERALQGEPIIKERKVVLGNSGSLWNEARYLPVYGNNGTIIGVSLNATDITKRKAAEQALFQSKQNLESLVNSQSSFLVRSNLSGDYTFVNNAFCQKFGARFEDLIGTSAIATVVEDDKPLAAAAMQRCVEIPGKVVPVLFRMRLKTGDPIWTQWELVALKNEDNEVTAYQAVGFDCTERVLAELELKKMNTRLQIVTEGSDLGIWELNARTGELFWDRKTFEIFGVPLNYVPSPQLVSTIIYAEDFANIEDHISAATPAENSIKLSFRITRLDSRQMRYIKGLALADFGTDGKLNKVTGIHFDVTDQELANQVLREIEQRFRTVADSAPVFFWMTDENNRTTYLSNQWYQYSGDKSGSEVKNGWFTHIHPDDYVKALVDYQNAFEKRGPLNLQYRLRGKDSVYRWFLDSGIPRFLDTGEFVGYIGICIDITDRVRAEAEVAEKTSFLEAVLGTIDVGILACNTEGEITLFNKFAENLYNLGNIDGTDPEENIFPEAERLQNDLNGLFTRTVAGEVVKEEEQSILLDGKTRHIVANGKPLQDGSGTTTGAVVAVHDITVRKQTEEKLLNMIHEKELLIREIHHRVKNNLQLISSILYLKTAAMKESEAKSFIDDTRQKVRSIALIHERLLQTGSVNEVELNDYLKQLVDDIRKANMRHEANILFDYSFSPALVSLDVAINCGLIINELITNSLKHAFRDRTSGKIEIHVTRESGLMKMLVRDNGISIPLDVAPGKSESFGMRILYIFIRQLKASFEIHREGGTEFEIVFKC